MTTVTRTTAPSAAYFAALAERFGLTDGELAAAQAAAARRTRTVTVAPVRTLDEARAARRVDLYHNWQDAA